MKKAIIFYAIDNFNKEYKFVVVCAENDVDETIKHNQKYCTEIYRKRVLRSTAHREHVENQNKKTSSVANTLKVLKIRNDPHTPGHLELPC
jgi:hypothetical protein